jgi:hypothetical protein
MGKPRVEAERRLWEKIAGRAARLPLDPYAPFVNAIAPV